jgi:simple sugar transport system permease protein
LSEKPEPIQETKPQEEDKRNFFQRIFVRKGMSDAVLLPILSVFTALIIGGLIIAFSDPDVLAAWGSFFQDPVGALSITITTMWDAYSAMFVGAFGSPKEMIASIRIWLETGDTRPMLEAFRSFSESLVIATPYIFAGLGVALGFRGGLFNIGAEGQLFVAGLACAYVGYGVKGLPGVIHLIVAISAGVLAGALWGAIPGYLKARTGAHEVINTIMMNYIAFRLTDYLLTGPMARPDGLPITPEVLPSAYIPSLFPRPMRLHWGFFIALAVAWLVYWFLWKTTKGIEIRMVGANPHASRYAGIGIAAIIVLTMSLSGALAGMAGVNQVLGLDHRMVRAFSTGYGFDAIALALLGNSHPLGVVLSSLLFGFLRGGAARMQSVAGVPVEIIRIIQGMVIIFVAAPEIIRSLYRIKPPQKEKVVVKQSTS